MAWAWKRRLARTLSEIAAPASMFAPRWPRPGRIYMPRRRGGHAAPAAEPSAARHGAEKHGAAAPAPRTLPGAVERAKTVAQPLPAPASARAWPRTQQGMARRPPEEEVKAGPTWLQTRPEAARYYRESLRQLREEARIAPRRLRELLREAEQLRPRLYAACQQICELEHSGRLIVGGGGSVCGECRAIVPSIDSIIEEMRRELAEPEIYHPTLVEAEIIAEKLQDLRSYLTRLHEIIQSVARKQPA